MRWVLALELSAFLSIVEQPAECRKVTLDGFHRQPLNVNVA